LNQEKLRKAGRSLLLPLVGLLVRVGVSAFAVTVFGLAVTAVAAWLIWEGSYIPGAVVLIFGSVLDAVDGEIARRRQAVSKSGAVLDSSCDRIGETLILGALLAGTVGASHPSLVYLVPAALGGSFMVSYVRARAEGVGLSCSVGILTRTERLVLLIAGIVASGVWDDRAAVIMLAILSAGTWITVVQRLAQVMSDGRGVPLDGK